jgi:ribonuclease E
MVVNDSPGEECRIAILEDGHLEELFTERTTTATNVGNIYKGRVTNVEPAIQAAFVDYGQGQAGFLHISDLHPRYFPGSRRTERVGKKIPRRSRPPIQEALKRNDEVLVQVLKQGIGTKGPTLTSYLSIPGRLLVMMPEMDRVGVSRKVEDPEQRRKMRQILDTLTLPDGFGFILRTAGFGKNKTELNRDAAYLTRLWRVMEKRIKDVGAPCELYTESDLLIRTIRDVLRTSIEAIVVDSEQAHDRASAFLRVVAPRSAPKVLRFRQGVPIFHAYDVERQIELIHSREVPLASGGKLVIDQTEALVAIDVNSGRSRGARDAETNAFRTNCEAVDEICRQLRLRDLGGLVVNDLIDMHMSRHRREIEDRFRAGLGRDRAKTTMLRISEFGIVELTRQRMRPSLRKSHFMACPHCDGHGEIKSPETVGGDGTRQAGYLLQFDRVRRVEMVCSSRVASVLLSAKRRELVRLEEESGKKIDVRVSDAIALDRVDFYAYDERNADIDISKLPAPKAPSLGDLEAAERKPAAPKPAADKKRRRRRKSAPADAMAMVLATAAETEAPEPAPEPAPELAPEPAREPAAKKGRSRRRRRKRAPAEVPAEVSAEVSAEAATPPEQTAGTPPEAAAAAEEDKDAARGDGSIRIHKLAKELGVPSRDVVERAKEQVDVEVKSHMSSVTRRVADHLRRFFGGPTPAKGKSGRSRRRTRGRGSEARKAKAAAADQKPAEPSVKGQKSAEPSAGEKKKRSRRSRGRRGPEPAAAETPAPAATEEKPTQPPGTQKTAEPSAGEKKKRSRRSRGRRAPEPAAAETPAPTPAPAATPAPAESRLEPAGETADSRPKGRTSSRRSRKKKQRTTPAAAAAGPKPSDNGDGPKVSGLDEAGPAGEKSEPTQPAKPRLYRSRRRLTRTAAKQLLEENAEE